MCTWPYTIGKGRLSTHWPVDEEPFPIEPVREQCRILVFRQHNGTQFFKCAEIPSKGKGDSRAGTGIGCVHNGPHVKLINSCDTRVFKAPCFFRVIRICFQRWPSVYLPAGYAVGAYCLCQVRKTAPVLYAGKQQNFPVINRCSRIKNSVYCVWPVVCGENRIFGAPDE